jgi:siderophore synthetase component
MNETNSVINKQIAKEKYAVSRVLEKTRWNEINRLLICKSISELMHELLITPFILQEKNDVITFKLKTDDYETCYIYKGTHRAMDHWVIDAASIKKIKKNEAVNELNAIDFYIEMQQAIGIQSSNLIKFIEELYKGLYADCFIAYNGKLTADEMTQASFQQIERQMDGHPWLIMNKGRLGFDYLDYNEYSPEAGKPIKLIWIAVSKSMATFNCMHHLNYDTLISNELDTHTLHSFDTSLSLQGFNPDNYFYMPVHEWQWNNKLIFLFASEIAVKNIIPISIGEDTYLAQQSIRTLFNSSNPGKNYVKTSLSILNTTLYRGLSPDKLKIAPMMAEWVNEILQKDVYLKSSGFILLNEVATLGYTHPHFKKIDGAPYQYNEMLGVVWRESIMNYTRKDEQPVTMASLLYQDDEKKTFVSSLIEKSGLEVSQWVNSYLEAYLKPLIHCFYRHQMFFVPHGENVILLLRNYVPKRMILKDFVEEVQLAPEAYDAINKEIQNVLYKIPEADVPLFIFTDIFDGFFRYLSSLLHMHLGYDEMHFWKQIARIILDYQSQFPELHARYKKYDLFAPHFRRFCLNRFRLVTSGYTENAHSPAEPPFAGVIENPISRYKKK